MKQKGKFIAIEGVEGAGKSTAIGMIKDILETQNIAFILTREPGGTTLGEALRTVIIEQDMDARTELLLFYAARIQLVEKVIKPALNEGKWVIGDRFELSTFAYQGGGRGIDNDMIQRLSLFALQGFKPDYQIYLDIDPLLGLERVKQRGALDRIEQENIDFFNRTRQVYLDYVNTHDDITMIDARLPINTIHDKINEIITQLI